MGRAGIARRRPVPRRRMGTFEGACVCRTGAEVLSYHMQVCVEKATHPCTLPHSRPPPPPARLCAGLPACLPACPPACITRGKRYLLAVNVMAASVLRGVAEAALSDLLDFFRIHSTVAGAADCENKSGDGDRDPGGGGGGGSGGVNCGMEGSSMRHDCPPLFKVRCGAVVWPCLTRCCPLHGFENLNFNADGAGLPPHSHTNRHPIEQKYSVRTLWPPQNSVLRQGPSPTLSSTDIYAW